MLARKKKAPDFRNILEWINTEPLTMVKLLSHVVLIDFWSYACINCRRSIPFIKRMHEKYGEKGLKVIGVHSPQFSFEKEPLNVKKAIDERGIDYPVALDSERSMWRAYGNSYWPSTYLIGRYGKIGYTRLGEGGYREMENMIQSYLGISEELEEMNSLDYMPYQSPETYAGFVMNNGLGSGIGCDDNGCNIYIDPGKHLPNTIYPDGRWKQEREYLEMLESPGKISYKFTARQVNVILEPLDKKVKADIFIDSRKKNEIEVDIPNIYTVYEKNKYKEHNITLKFKGKVRLYAFTFG